MITPRPNSIYEIKIDTPLKSRQIQQINLMDAPLRSPKAGGTPIAQRKLLKITFVRYLDETDSAGDPQLFEADAVETSPAPAETESVETPETEAVAVVAEDAQPEEVKVEQVSAEKPARTVKKASPKKADKQEKAQPVEPETSAPVKEEKAEPEEEEETWGIQPDLGF